MVKEKESIEDQLLEALDKQTEPYAAWKAPGVKEQIQKSTAVVRAKADYTKEVKGPEIREKFEAYSTDALTAAGLGGNGDPKMLAHQFRLDLGDHYSEFHEALKMGDSDTMGKLTKDALENKVGVAQLESIIERMSLLTPDARIGLGKKLVAKVGGKDYVSAITNPGQLAQTLTRQKAMAEAYK